MNFLLHNRIEISNGHSQVYCYNSMLKSVLQQIGAKQSYNDFIALGQGDNEDYSKTNCKLSNHLKSYKLECEYLQDDVLAGTLYIKKTAVIDDSFLDGKVITEAGLTNSLDKNPTIFNYFQLKSDDGTIGIAKRSNVPLVISVYIFLEISKSSHGNGLLTAGKNKFIDFLLGNGLEDEIYCARGNIYIDNSKPITREESYSTKYPCQMTVSNDEGKLQIAFSSDLGAGSAVEVLMMIGSTPFARISTISKEDTTLLTAENLSVSANSVVKVDNDVCEVVSVKNNNNSTEESDFAVRRCATSFGDKVSLPFNNIFDNNTSRFISKDGSIIFFVIDDKVYGYKNETHAVIELDTSAIDVKNIINIIMFEEFAFVIAQNTPYLYAFKLNEYCYNAVDIDFGEFDQFEVLSNIFKSDMTYTKDNKVMLSIIKKGNNNGWTFYFNYNQLENKFVYDGNLCYKSKFNYVLSMYRTKYNDAMTIFLKADPMSFLCEIVYHYADKTYSDLYSMLSYYLTSDTKELYPSNRAIVVEQLSTPKLWLYLYPEIKKIDLQVQEGEVEDYISTNLKYLIQKFDDGNFKFYNLFDYENVTEFSNGLPSYIASDQIADFAFLNDVVLLFLNGGAEKIVALSLYENETYIENVSSNTDTYDVSYSKYNIAGENNKNVISHFALRINL